MPEFGIENGIFATLPLQIGTGVNPGINYLLINYLFYFNQYCNVITSQTITVFCLHTSFISYFNFKKFTVVEWVEIIQKTFVRFFGPRMFLRS